MSKNFYLLTLNYFGNMTAEMLGDKSGYDTMLTTNHSI